MSARRAEDRVSTSSLPKEESRALAQVLRCLDLERLDDDLFLGDPGPGEGRLFGGMVAMVAGCLAYTASIAEYPGAR